MAASPPGRPVAQRIRRAHLDGGDRGVGMRGGQGAAEMSVVHRRQSRGADDQRDERPQAEQLAAQSGGEQMAQIW